MSPMMKHEILKKITIHQMNTFKKNDIFPKISDLQNWV
jgi:hypothetical protein